MSHVHRHRSIVLLVLTVCLAHLAACGGGGDGVESPSPRLSPRKTTFVGNLSEPASRSAELSTPAGVVLLPGPVEVCVGGTDFCTAVHQDGTFTLDANVGGDIVLVFQGPDFTARLGLNDVPAGATVRIQNIRCSTTTGRCSAEDVEITPAANQPPICSAAAARPLVVWPPNHSLVRITIGGVTDPDGDPVVVAATDVFQDEPVDEQGTGSGNTGPDATLGPLAVRAERSGQGNGRVYTVSFIADDRKGGMCTGIVQVCVPHDQGKGATCIDDGAQHDSLLP